MRGRGSIVGFTAWRRLSPDAVAAARTAQARVVGRFDHLTTRSWSIGSTTVDVWGLDPIDSCLHEAPDGSRLLLIGAPQMAVSWSDLPRAFVEGDMAALEALPWDGRLVLLRISADGEHWTLCSDWLGSIPVFHAAGPLGPVASTLEPVVVSAMGYTPSDIHMAALLCILLNGHLLSDWTFHRGMRTVPPDTAVGWDRDGQPRSRRLCSVEATRDRWEVRWNDLVDEMHALATRAVAGALAQSPAWMLPLSGGLDSRLIACIGHALGVDMDAYVWGASDTVDVVCSRTVARRLKLPWRHVDLGTAYLTTWTRPWADWFGTTMHFHGMYQMAFYDAVADVRGRPIVSGFLNDILSGTSAPRQVVSSRGQLYTEWYRHWTIEELRDLLRVPLDEALAELAAEIETQLRTAEGVAFKEDLVIGLRNRNRLFTSFQPILADYWRGAATPFMNRDYARFCLSLPLGARNGRRLLGDVFCRFYPAIAAVPGTYDEEPLFRTGSYLLKRRVAEWLPQPWRLGPLKVFRAVDPRMDCDALRAAGPAGLWPIPEAERQLAEWLDVGQLRPLYDRAVSDARDYRALRRLQSVQTLAFRLLES
jgi:hypothetical protein